MTKTAIPWADYSINPVKGLCPMDCKDLAGKPYCYARKMYRRFKWNPEIRYDDWVWQEGGCVPKGSKIFVGSTMELFGEWVEPSWLDTIFAYCRACPSHTFIFLTKQPQNLAKWSPFPPNVWVGVSATDTSKYYDAAYWLKEITTVVKFISFEPLLERILPNKAWPWRLSFQEKELWAESGGINWLILGSRTQPIRHPPREWVDEIISAADKAGIPVFVKDPMASHFGIDRKEWPGK